MSFTISDTADAIAAAINDFNPQYHEDYRTVKTEAAKYRFERPPANCARQLAGLLQEFWRTGAKESVTHRPATRQI